MKILSSLLVGLLVFGSSGYAGQSAPSPGLQQGQVADGPQILKIKGQVERRGAGGKSKVRVTLGNGSVVKGEIGKIDELSFVVTNGKTGQSTTIAYSDVRKIRGPGLSTGAKIGIGVGVAALVVVIVVVAAWERFNHSKTYIPI